METTVTKTWKPTVAGVLNIVAGVSSLLGVLGVIVAIIFVGSGPLFWDSFPGLGPLTVGFLEGVLVITAVFLAVVGILPLLGGIYAVQRRKWGLALAGSIAAIFGSTPLGIAAVILLALSKDEFN
ncbi:MAG TPA: hypothetical protein G4O09_04165 [Dehalococcoidia bacterium]|nr:hypothetical protein [Dehalococcoidia bacterium]